MGIDTTTYGAAVGAAKTYTDAEVAALETAIGSHLYGIRWDKTNSQCVRFGDAEFITTTITNFAHRGSVTVAYFNPFDSRYPWSGRRLCNVNRAAYAALPAGSPITDAVTAWEGEPGFALDGSGDMDAVYTPGFWAKQWEDSTYVYIAVSDVARTGYQYFEPTIGGRYFGSLDGNGKITSIANGMPLRNTRMDTVHANAQAQGMTLDDIFTWCADTILMAVEYATLNTQTAVGAGCDGLYRQDASNEKVGANAAIGDTLLKLPNAFVAACAPGAIIGLGTSLGGEQTGVARFISSADLDGADPLAATHKGVTVPALAVNVTTDTFVCIHGCYNAPDAAIGSMSGYLGTASKVNTYYRGRVAHAGFWRYVLGAYRQKDTDKIWVANSRAEAAAADALNIAVHRDTGKVLPAAEGYIAALGLDALLPLAPICTASGGAGGSTNPVGDYCYKPAIGADDTVLLAGGHAYYGASCGRFFGYWSTTVANLSWFIAALPFLKTP